jgi:hypothetical protein
MVPALRRQEATAVREQNLQQSLLGQAEAEVMHSTSVELTSKLSED